MYLDVANMTLEEVNKVCQSLSSAKMDAYLTKVGGGAYLYTVDKKHCTQEIVPILAQI